MNFDQPHKPTPQTNPATGMWALFIALMCIIVWSNRGSLLWFLPSDSMPRLVTPRGDLAADEQSTIDLFERASKSVAYVSPLQRVRDRFSLDVFDVPGGTGSGFVWDDQGHIVTNFHVIQDASACQVVLADGSAWDATLVGASRDKDIAVLRIGATQSRLYPIVIGESHDLRVGQKVFAIGNPFGLDFTLTTGVVSALEREIQGVSGRKIQGVIQTDAAINPGNSGGPLLDSAGRLIGVNTAIYSPSGSSAGIGFAVPVDTVNRVVPDIIEHGRVIRPGLGISVAPDHYARNLGIEGVIVLNVPPGSAADKAGLQGMRELRSGRIVLGDVIVAINDTTCNDRESLRDALEQHQVGDQVVVTLNRDDRQVSVQVVLQPIN